MEDVEKRPGKGQMSGRVMITGGTGSLGHAILARANREGWDCAFTIFSRDEVKQGDMRSLYPAHRYVLGDIRDREWLTISMRGHTTVIHAAAYKQVPAAEVHSREAIQTNIHGSENVAMAAVEAGVNKVLGISSDKACAPVNMYGMSKAAMEKLFQEAAEWKPAQTSFTLVRYGNVLGTRGSVVPLFRRQAQEGVITITDPTMTRFWLTLEDAIDVILEGLQEDTGLIVIPKAPASDMVTLAKAVAPEAEIRLIGTRPGEKRHERLIHAGEATHVKPLGEYFYLFPAYRCPMNELPDGWEYGSETAPQLTVDQLRAMLEVHP